MRPLRLSPSTLPRIALSILTVACATAASAPRAHGGAEETGSGAATPRTTATARAVSEDGAEARAAAAELRARGPEGLAALEEAHRGALARLREGASEARRDPALRRLRAALERVAAQRDAHASGLYWYTDLEDAKREAQRLGRPILSLRLLGLLSEELSCANSRYFRLLLYPDAAVARLLRERFVLHWSSERPAPRITIDLGDGRRIERTITGNSAHVVLDAEGRPVDALVGLLTPAAFTRELARAAELASTCGEARDDARAACLARGHAEAARELGARWERDRLALRGLPEAAILPSLAPRREGAGRAGPVSAWTAMPVTVSKARVETPMLGLMQRVPAPMPLSPPWFAAVAARRAELPHLDARALGLLRLKTGRTDVAELAARLVALAAEDSVRNEHVYHPTVHAWFQERPQTLDALVARVYDELFLMPADDPWLGLRTPDLFDGVELPLAE